MKERLAASVLALTMSLPAMAQTPNAVRAFDVVSIKASDLERGTTAAIQPGRPTPGGGWSAEAATVRMLIERAFPEFSKPGMITGGPRWISERQFDVEARASRALDATEYPALLQRLLADRFSLRTHTERRPVDVYRLVVARAGRLGPRLRPASPRCLADLEAERQQVDASGAGPAGSGAIGPCGRHTTSDDTVHMIDARSMASLATTLQAITGRAVTDHTGLSGVYEIDLEWDISGSGPVQASPDAGAGPAIEKALREQLGLKLERHRDLANVLVIDAVTLPTAN